MPLPQSRIWLRYRARAIAKVKGNFKNSHDDLSCRFCDQKDQITNQNFEETQEHLEICGGTVFERRGLDMSTWKGVLHFWRRMTKKLATATMKSINPGPCVIK